MLGAALTPYMITIMIWVQIIYAVIIGDPILWYSWLIVLVCSIGSIVHITYKFFYSRDDSL